MWHACKQRAFAVLGLQKFTSNRGPLGVPKESKSVNPNFLYYMKFLPCHASAGQDTQQNSRKTCDGHSNKDYQHLHYCPWLETISWVGTAFAIGLNYTLCTKTRNANDTNELKKLSCFCKATNLLLRLALLMPKTFPKSGTNILSCESSTSSVLHVCNEDTTKIQSQPPHLLSNTKHKIEESRTALEDVTCKYFAELENLAGLEMLTIDKRKAFGHFLLASDLGSTKGHFNVGICYETGQGTYVDFLKAADYFTKASEADHALASYNLGLYYMEGRGNSVVQQPEEGLKYMLKSAELGLADAHYYLGVCYQAGWIVKQNVKTAKEFFSKAASLGHQGAEDSIAEMSEELLEKDSNDILKNEDLQFNIEPPVVECNPLDLNVKESVRQVESDFSSQFHVSMSSPDLMHAERSKVNMVKQTYELAISRYLDVILPYQWIPEDSEDVTATDFEFVQKIPLSSNKVMKVRAGM